MTLRWFRKEPQKEGEWRTWFAWRPVYILDVEGYHTILWFIRVERRFYWHPDSLGGHREWEYRS